MRNPENCNTAYRRRNKQMRFLTALERYGCDWETVSKFVGLTVKEAKRYYIIMNKRFEREEREEREERRRKQQSRDLEAAEDLPDTRTVGVQYGEGVYLPGWKRPLI